MGILQMIFDESDEHLSHWLKNVLETNFPIEGGSPDEPPVVTLSRLYKTLDEDDQKRLKLACFNLMSEFFQYKEPVYKDQRSSVLSDPQYIHNLIALSLKLKVGSVGTLVYLIIMDKEKFREYDFYVRNMLLVHITDFHYYIDDFLLAVPPERCEEIVNEDNRFAFTAIQVASKEDIETAIKLFPKLSDEVPWYKICIILHNMYEDLKSKDEIKVLFDKIEEIKFDCQPYISQTIDYWIDQEREKTVHPPDQNQNDDDKSLMSRDFKGMAESIDKISNQISELNFDDNVKEISYVINNIANSNMQIARGLQAIATEIANKRLS